MLVDTIPAMLARHSETQATIASLGSEAPRRPATESGLAESIADKFCGRLAFIPELRAWHVYEGRRWAQDNAGQATQTAKLACRSNAARAETAGSSDESKAWRRLEAAGRLRGALEIAASEARLVRHIAAFDADPWKLNTPGGLVDLRTGALEEHAPEHYCMMLAGATPRYDEDAPIFNRFMLEIADGRPDLAAYLVVRAAYALTGDTSLQDLGIHVGSGANGKTVLQALQAALGGDYAGQAEAGLLLDKDSHGPSPELLSLRGRRLVSIAESAEADRLNLALVKRLTGGDLITARALFSNQVVTFRPAAKFVLSTNHAPRLNRVDYAIRRRVRLIPFDRRFEGATRDPRILDAMLAERDAIMGLLVRAAQGYAASLQLPPCSTVDAASDAYLDDEDVVGRWIAECARLDPEASTPAADVYKNFAAWQESEGTKPWSSMAFGLALNERGISRRKLGKVFREGIALL